MNQKRVQGAAIATFFRDLGKKGGGPGCSVQGDQGYNFPRQGSISADLAR